MPNRGITYDRRPHAGNYDVRSAAGSTLGSVQKTSKGWAASIPTGIPLPVLFASRGRAGEALFQAADDRYRAARDTDLGRRAPDGATFFVDVQDNEAHCLVVTHEDVDGVNEGEFTFRWVDLDGDPCPCPRMESYNDGWRALHASGLLPFMALWAENISMVDMITCLRNLGFVIRRDMAGGAGRAGVEADALGLTAEPGFGWH